MVETNPENPKGTNNDDTDKDKMNQIENRFSFYYV